MAASAKQYSNTKYALNIAGTFYTIILILLALGSGFSLYLDNFLQRLGLLHSLAIAVFLLIISVCYYLLNFPLNLYSGFILEHKFNLTKQKFSDWWLDQLKSLLVGLIISLILVFVFYWILDRFNSWWLVISIFWIFFSVILAKLTPVLIIPLFFKYKKLEDEALRLRILDLAKNMGVKLLDIFEIDFSKKTLKANAAFTGMGKTKRVLLADTLKDKYTHNEVIVILAHEFAHYQLRHIWKLILTNSLITLGLFFIIFKTNAYWLEVFKLSSLTQLASLPLVFLYFIIFGVILQPLEAYISRRFERAADLLALKTTKDKEGFISVMSKLASQNLADTHPHPLIKFFFFDHPPIDERIEMAKSYSDYK